MWVSQKIWFLYVGFSKDMVLICGFLLHIKNTIWDVPQPQKSITVQKLSATTVRECRTRPGVLMQNIFDGMVNQCRRCQNAARHFPIYDVQLLLNLIDICLDNMLQILYLNCCYTFSRFEKLTAQKSPKFGL